jgi:hypothetical protein
VNVLIRFPWPIDPVTASIVGCTDVFFESVQKKTSVNRTVVAATFLSATRSFFEQILFFRDKALEDKASEKQFERFLYLPKCPSNP